MKRISLFTLFILIFTFVGYGSSDKLKVLILSGGNNHDWKTTTPKLKSIYEKSGLFEVKVAGKPETLNPKVLTNYDVIVSNWNSFPEKNERWPVEFEDALLEFIRSGKGFVTYHASATCLNNGSEFATLSAGTWTKEINNRERSATHVRIQNKKHPITKEMLNFYIEDALWISAENNKTFEILGNAENKLLKEKETECQPAIMVKDYGKGRVFHTILGHDMRALQNIGFQTLMLRGAEWAATGKVKQKLPQELRENIRGKYKWAESDTTFALMNGKDVVWKYNFREFHQKPFFNPVNIGRNNITCVSPDDHHWHAGQWFSWKYINGVNYWEFVEKTIYKSEGTTDIKNVKLTRKKDFSAEIVLDIIYHPENGADVLAETRTIHVSAPQEDGQITMDYQFEFKALTDSVELSRTPVLGEENGKSWGGYAGLSLRFNQSFMDSYFISGLDNNGDPHGQNGNWLYMGFKGLDGTNVGSQIIINQNTKREEAGWYVSNNVKFPFYYISPSYLFNKPLLLLKNEKLVLNYRINHFAGKIDKPELEKEFLNYKTEQNH